MFHFSLLTSFSSIPHNYLPLGIEEDLGIGSNLELNGTTDEDVEAEGLRRGVTALLEVSFAMGEGVAVIVVTGCNSTSVPVARSLGGVSSIVRSSSSIDSTVLVSV